MTFLSSQALAYKVHSREVTQKVARGGTILGSDKSSWPYIYVYQISAKYLKGTKSYWVHTLSTLKFIKGRSLIWNVRETTHSCTRHTVLTIYTCLPNIIKISRRVWKLLSAQTFVYGRTPGWSLHPPNLVDQGIKIETYSTKLSFCCLGHAPGVGCWR